MSMTNLKIGTRLGVGFAALLLLLAIMVGASIGRLSSLNDNVVNLAEEHMPKLLVSNEWIIAMLQTARQTRNMLILEGPEKIKDEIEGGMKLKVKRRELMDELQKAKAMTSTEGKAVLQKVVDARAAYTPHEDEYLRLVGAGDFANAKSLLLEKARPTQLVYIDAIYKLVHYQTEQIKSASQEAQAEYREGRNLMLALLAAALLIGAGYAFFVTRSITRPMNAALVIAQTVAAGDLTSRIEATSTDETGLRALKNMNDNLVSIATRPAPPWMKSSPASRA